MVRVHLHWRDSSGAALSGELEAHDPREVERLVARLRMAVAIVQGMTHDEEEGHPFHGNQYTGGIGGAPDEPKGPKPTKAEAKGVKSGVHQLLSTGHPFSMKELQEATGATTVKQISDALAMLKNPKYAGKAGTLEIVKHGDQFKVKPVSAPAPLPAPEPEPPKAEPEPYFVGKYAPPGQVAKPMSAHPMQKDEADKIYESATKAALEDIKDKALIAAPTTENHTLLAQNFKDMKAAQMAQWAANTKGAEVAPKKQQVFKADLELITDLAAGAHIGDALKEWKKNTAAEKAGTWPVDKFAAAIAAEKAQAAKTAASVAHVDTQAKHEPHFPVVADYHPAGHSHVSKDDFVAGQATGKSRFGAGIEQLKEALSHGHPDSVQNKLGVQGALTERLKDSKAFQALKAQVTGSGMGALEARLISAWASTSADTHPVSICNQIAVRDAFAMDPHFVSIGAAGSKLKGEHALEEEQHRLAAANLGISVDTPERMATFRAGLRDFALAQYHNTQDHLKQLGIKEVYVARGMKSSLGASDKAQVGKLRLQPASSFSANYGTAFSFSGHSTVYFAKVPAEQVLSSYVTGFGCTSEHEVVVLAHPEMEAVQCKATQATGYLGTAMQHVAATLGAEKSQIGKAAPTPEAIAKAKKAAEKKAALEGSMPATVQGVNALHPEYPKAPEGMNTKNKATISAKLEAGDLAGLKQIALAFKGKKNVPKSKEYVAAAVKHLEGLHKASLAAKPKAPAQPKPQSAAVEPPPNLQPSATAPTAHAPKHIAEHPHYDPVWYAQQVAAGKTHAQMGKTLAAKKFAAKLKQNLEATPA